MKKYAVFFAVLFYVASVSAYTQSLGDLAREEKKRREAAPDGIAIVFETARTVVPDYAFSALAGAWSFTSGSGSGAGTFEEQSGTWVAEILTGSIQISDMEDLGDETARGEIVVQSLWRVTVDVPGYGSETNDVPLSSDRGVSAKSSMKLLKKTGNNVFVYESTISGGGVLNGSGTVTITLTSGTTADVVQSSAYNEAGVQSSGSLKYSLKKQ